MPPPPLRWIAVTAATVAAVLCGVLLTREPGATPRTAGKGMAHAALVTGKGFASSPAEPLPKFGTPEFKSTLHERGLKWLDSRGRDAAGLIAMWDLTGDRALLDEAAENSPNDPRVCMAKLAIGVWFTHISVDTDMLWIERQIAAESANPEGYYLKAWKLCHKNFEFRGGMMRRSPDIEGVMEALSQAAAISGPPNEHWKERAADAYQAAIALGVGPGDAARLGLRSPSMLRIHTPILDAVTTALKAELVQARNAGREDYAREIVALGLTTAEKFSRVQALLISDELHANELKMCLLSEVPADVEIGERGLSAGSQREEAEERITILKHLQGNKDVMDLMATASDDVMDTYYLVLMRHGEEDAQSWLLKQAKEPNRWTGPAAGK